VPVVGLGGVELSSKGGPTSFGVEVGRGRLFGMGDGRDDEELGWEVPERDATSEGRPI